MFICIYIYIYRFYIIYIHIYIYRNLSLSIYIYKNLICIYLSLTSFCTAASKSLCLNGRSVYVLSFASSGTASLILSTSSLAFLMSLFSAYFTKLFVFLAKGRSTCAISEAVVFARGLALFVVGSAASSALSPMVQVLVASHYVAGDVRTSCSGLGLELAVQKKKHYIYNSPSHIYIYTKLYICIHTLFKKNILVHAHIVYLRMFILIFVYICIYTKRERDRKRERERKRGRERERQRDRETERERERDREILYT